LGVRDRARGLTMPILDEHAQCMHEDEDGKRCDAAATVMVMVETISLTKAKVFCATHLVTFAYENVRKEWETQGRAAPEPNDAEKSKPCL
jgi:hypothetical protein